MKIVNGQSRHRARAASKTWPSAVLLGVLGLGVALPVLANGAGGRDCQCRDPGGERRDLGTVQCVDINGSAWIVRCEMSTNTPYWKRLDSAANGCTLA